MGWVVCGRRLTLSRENGWPNKPKHLTVHVQIRPLGWLSTVTTLVGDWKWFGPGSRVIITCRDSHLLKRNKVNGICEVQLLQTTDALQLFSLSTFDKTNPPKNYKDLSMNFRFLKKKIFDILKISFDGLEESQKKLFLDVACFCHQRSLPIVYYFKEISLAIDSEVLVDKSLLSKSLYDEGYLIMHALLEKMGQEIVRLECPKEAGRRSRLFRVEDVVDVLKNDTGTYAIESIVLGICPTKERLKAKAFSKMRKLRLLHSEYSGSITWHGNPLKYIPSDKLQFLNWVQCPSKFWPSSFQPKNLNVLSMPTSRFKRLWKGLMVLPNLKILDLSCSKSLIETPDLTGVPNLEEINLIGCTSLCEVHPSIGDLKRLQKLKMCGTEIKQLWKGLAVLHNLNYLNLKDSENLIEIPDLSGAPNLEEIKLEGCTSLCKIHPSIGFLKRLKRLSLDGCSRLMNFQNILGDMTSLESLSMNFPIFPSVRLDGHSRLEKFPDLSRLECLKEFKAYGTAITQIPSVNLIPKSIHSLDLEGRKRMPRESRDLVMFINDYSLPKQNSYPTNHDIGSPVEYEMEEMLEVEALGISLCSSSFGNTVLIKGWSLGSRIPEWVHNKSNGSSLQIELDGNTMSVIGCAIFIVCDCHQFHSPEATSIPRLFKETSNVVFSFCFERDDGSLEELFHPNWSAEVSLVKPGVY
ncbi:hypothetical protein I3842_14G134200 [Carya illinoinensis]|uniref:Disease resistance protein Roq1-like winged-helix domain-containing protein n=1 Tax=Carya illinoinensis TaxID=32201 RepID=A0A922ALY8_CARIL|nr:hypothetical protein I3842_14G134200 [Carya illinoinensis]